MRLTMARPSKLYSETMRELSFLPLDELELYQMRWGLIDVDPIKVREKGLAFYESIPLPTTVQLNAMKQIMASGEDSYERKEWADRVEGKATQTTVNVNHDTKEGIDVLEAYSRQKLDSLFGEMEDE